MIRWWLWNLGKNYSSHDSEVILPSFWDEIRHVRNPSKKACCRTLTSCAVKCLLNICLLSDLGEAIMSTWPFGRLKSTRSVFWNWSPVTKLIKIRLLLSRQMTAMHQLYSVAFIPTEMRVNMKVGGRIPKRMAVWVSISFLSVQQILARLSSTEKG